MLELACAGSSALSSGRDRTGTATAPLPSAAAILELCDPSVGTDAVLSCIRGVVQKVRGTRFDRVLCVPGHLAAVDADDEKECALALVTTLIAHDDNKNAATASGVVWEDCEIFSVAKRAAGVMRSFREETVERAATVISCPCMNGQNGRRFSSAVGSPPKCTDIGASAYVRLDLNEHGTRRAGIISTFDAVHGNLIFHIGQEVFHSSCSIAKIRESLREITP